MQETVIPGRANGPAQRAADGANPESRDSGFSPNGAAQWRRPVGAAPE
jgi:hypothetical protein